MGRGLRRDLIDRMKRCFASQRCVVPESPSDAHRLRAALRSGHVVSPFPQLYVLPEQWLSLNREKQELYKIRSLATLHSDWIFCDVSAAVIQGLWVSYSLMNSIHIVTTSRAHSRSSRWLTRHEISDFETKLVDGVRVTTLERTTFDCLRRISFRKAMPIADSVLRKSGKDINHFTSAFQSFHRGAQHHQRAIEIMGFANALSESGGESAARAAMIEQGYMLPMLQVEVTNAVDSGSSYFVDFCWELPEEKIYGEMDGREKYTNPDMTHGRNSVDVLADERLRESHISINRVKIVRFGYRDIANVRRFRHLLDTFGVPSGYDVPAVARADDPLNRVR